MFSNDNEISESSVMSMEVVDEQPSFYKKTGQLTEPGTIHAAFSDFKQRMSKSSKVHIQSQELYKDQVIRQYSTDGAPVVSVIEQIIFRNQGMIKITDEKGTKRKCPSFSCIVSYVPYYSKKSHWLDILMSQSYIATVMQHYNEYVPTDHVDSSVTMDMYGKQILKLKEWKKKNSSNS